MWGSRGRRWRLSGPELWEQRRIAFESQSAQRSDRGRCGRQRSHSVCPGNGQLQYAAPSDLRKSQSQYTHRQHSTPDAAGSSRAGMYAQPSCVRGQPVEHLQRGGHPNQPARLRVERRQLRDRSRSPRLRRATPTPTPELHTGPQLCGGEYYQHLCGGWQHFAVALPGRHQLHRRGAMYACAM